MLRSILHCDMNNFYASVECMLDPALKKYPIAVCGSVEERHGIVLAKNYKAKAFDVKTGDAVWQAKQKCKDLVVVPPHYEEYIKYSKLARSVYERYTDQVEPYGMDECWLDISGTESLFGSPEKVANEIRETMKFELGLTISVGVSFNKIFAKLGSDMKKPDAVTVIPKDTFKEKIWGLPAADLLGVGRATQRTLDSYCIRTIGDLANTDPEFLRRTLGKNGVVLWNYANGNDIYVTIPDCFMQGCSEDIVIFRADGGNHFTDYGIYEGMFLFFDRKKNFKKGRLSCYTNTTGDDRPKYKVSDKDIDGYEHFGRLVLTLRNYEV